LVLDPGAASEKKRDFESGIYPAYAVRDAIDVKNPIGTYMQTRKKGGKNKHFIQSAMYFSSCPDPDLLVWSADPEIRNRFG
jgi:hypothetical protein